MPELLRRAREDMHLQAVSFRNGPPWAAESGTLGAYGIGRLWRWRPIRVHGPVSRTMIVSSTTILNVCDGRSVSKCVPASLAAASARSLPRILVWTLILWRVLRRLATLLASRRSVMLPRRSLWWWLWWWCPEWSGGAIWLGGWTGNP
jgi:hypothetical protein